MPEITPTERAAQSFAALADDAQALISATPPGEAAIIVDGSMYSPSTRAIFGAEAAWQGSNDIEWEEFEGELEGAIEAFEREGYTLGWEDGCLFLFGPAFEHPDNIASAEYNAHPECRD